VSGEPPQDLVCVLRSSDPFELGLAKSLLESAEVPFVVLGESVATSMRLPLTYGSAQVMVAARDAGDARAILDDGLQGADECESDDDAHS
jgi:hypothetical protein